MRPASALLLALLPTVAFAGSGSSAPLGASSVQDGIEIVPGIETGVQFDRPPTSLAADTVFLTAEMHATKDNIYGFTGFIPYLSISFSLTRDGEPTFKKSGLLYPTAGKSGPRYIGAAGMGGPGTYHLTYIVSPPSAHGMYRQTGKENGVPDWWKPITASWTFSYPNSSNPMSVK
ncbi:MAG TPA: iron transporter [Rhizomicrobium sp.]|nr:iron transporter [Rhizomicrobium sp.]